MTHTSTEPEPITNQEIQAAADRIAHDLVTYALSEIRDLLGDGIAETIADDKVADRLDRQTRGIVYGLVWDRLAQAGADYQRRDQVLTEAADKLERIADETEAKVAEHYGPASGIGPGSADMVRESARTVRSLAARTTQEG